MSDATPAPDVAGAPHAADAADASDASARLAAWRASGAQRLDPVRFSFLEALARRAGSHGGEVRQWLDRRLTAALDDYGRRVQAAEADRLASAPARPATARRPVAAADKLRTAGPLADLVRLLAPPAGGPRTAPELKALHAFRRSLTRRNSEQQLAQSQAVLPENAGPLHSQALVLRALQLMRSLSPEYLARFMSHAETLLWLEQAHGASLPAPRNVVRGASDAVASVTPGPAAASPSGTRKPRSRRA